MSEEDKIKQEENELKEAGDETCEAQENQNEPEAEATEKTDAEKLQEAEEQIAQLKDQLLRQMAEFDNFRKRTLKEKTDLILNGGRKVLESLLPVLDDLERAQENI